MNVSRIALPGKSNLAMAHDEASPKMTFDGTLMTATRKVSRMAEPVSCVRHGLPIRRPSAGERLSENVEQRQQ